MQTQVHGPWTGDPPPCFRSGQATVEQNGLAATAELESFAGVGQPKREHWRSIVLFGRNVASYKFTLAKSLLKVAGSGQEIVPLAELAESFAPHVCEHLIRVDRQGTFERSRFLDAGRYHNAGGSLPTSSATRPPCCGSTTSSTPSTSSAPVR